MDDCEIELWNAILLYAIVTAGNASIRSAVVIEAVLQQLGDKKVNR